MSALSRTVRSGVVVLMLGVLAACTPAGAGENRPLESSAPATPPPASSAPSPAPSVPVTQATLAPPMPDAPAPKRLVYSAQGVDMPVSATGVQDDGSMEIPDDPFAAGWYRYGAAPADGQGITVIAAHVDSRKLGIGPLSKLREGKPGDILSVEDAEGQTYTYEVEEVTYIPRAELPVADLFERSGEARLTVITCGGSFDEKTRTYSDNVVLVARALP